MSFLFWNHQNLITSHSLEYGFWFYHSFALNALETPLIWRQKLRTRNGSKTFENLQFEIRTDGKNIIFTTKLIYIPVLWFIFLYVYFTPSQTKVSKTLPLPTCHQNVTLFKLLPLGPAFTEIIPTPLQIVCMYICRPVKDSPFFCMEFCLEAEMSS